MRLKPKELLIYRPDFDSSQATGRMIRSDVLRIAVPSVIEMTLSSTCNMVDTIMVSSLGTCALAAVGISIQPRFALMVLFLGLNVGFTTLVARLRGQQDMKAMNAALRQAILVGLVGSVVMGAVGLLLSHQMMGWMGALPGETLEMAAAYFRVQMVFFPAQMVSMAIANCLRGAGHTRAALLMNLVPNVLNIPLNFLLIYGVWIFPRLGVVGASLATGIAMTVSMAMGLVIIFTRKFDFIFTRRDSWKPDFTLLKRVFTVGGPALLEQLILRVGFLGFARIVSALGTVAYATHQAAMTFQSLTFMAGQAFAVAATTLVGQSLGRGMPDMAKKYASQARNIALVIATGMGLVIYFSGGQLIDLLFSDDPEVIALGAQVMKGLAVCQPFMVLASLTAGVLRGAGDMRPTVVSSFLGVCLVRPAVAALSVFVLHQGLGLIWVLMILDYIVRYIPLQIRFYQGKWLKHEV